jgi:succinyl-diaminopimelate desuccinylase
MSGTSNTDALPADVDIELSAEALVPRLQRFVAIRSVNPGTFESAMADAAISVLGDLPDLVISKVESLPGRHSVAAVMSSGRPGPRLVMNGHLDTVPEGDPSVWTVPPFEGRIVDGYVYGRGACDMKAGLVAQIAAARALSAAGGPRRGSLVLQFAIGEEQAEPGTRSLCDAGFGGDVGIVTEPTGLRVATAARGMACFRILVTGRSGHASSPIDAANPIVAVPDVLARVERYVDGRAGRHPLLPSGTCTPTMLQAGETRNAIPDTCELVFDRRLLPGQSVAGELIELRKAFDDLGENHPHLTLALTADPFGFEPAEIAEASPFAQLVNEARCTITGDNAPVVGTSFSSDVHVLVNAAGMDAVTFGPGHIADCHCADERISIQQLKGAAQILHRVATQLLG